MVLKRYKFFCLEDTFVSILEFENEKKKILMGLLIRDSEPYFKDMINSLSNNNKYSIRSNIIN